MKKRFQEALAEVGPRARRHGFWIALPLAVLAVVVVAATIRASAAERAAEWQERYRAVRSTEVVVEDWRHELVPLAAEETIAWRVSARAARERGIEAGDRIALMQVVAQRAEELGVADVRVGFVRSDTLRVREIREVSGDVFEMAPYAVSLRFLADYPATARVVGALPPQVDVHRLRLTHLDGGELEADLLLVVYLGVGS
jgi:hypothetical protein